MYRQSADSEIPLHQYSQAPGHESYADLPSKPTQYPAGSSGVKGGRAGAGGRGGRKKWPWVVGALVLVAIILGAVLGGVLGSRAANNDNNKNNSASGGNANAAAGGGTSGAQDPATRTKGSGNEAVVPTATDAFGNPLYPTTTGSAVIAQPTVVSNAALQCPAEDTSGLSLSNPKKSHPLLIATETRWNCLPALIAADSYMSYWNDTVFLNASRFADMDPVAYVEDGGLSGSGVLDPAREVQLRIKHWAYAYKLSNDTKWVDRTWRELQVASGNTSTPFGQSNPNGDIWNCQSHFLDCAEFTEAFALAYDWMYEAWTAEQRTAIMWSILNQGLSYGLNVFEAPTGAGSAYQWWSSVDGNWNCVCNKGMTMGALAIINEDPTNRAKSLLGYTVPNANAHCAYSPSPDGTWSETANYWYFGTYSHVEMAASLLSATGSTQNLLDANPGMKLSATYHMYVTGLQGLFNYGDAGPNKYTATANGLMFYGQQYDMPQYTLFQRDRGDAPEPMSLLYYNPAVSGQFWDGLALDRHFSNTTDAWFSGRMSWTNQEGTYIAMKAGALTGHQTHGDLDAGDFVIDALGQRWAGELGSGDYLSNGYFSSEAQNSPRWLYYRKRTEGQNTFTINNDDQVVTGVPTTKFESTGEAQDALDYAPANSSTVYFTTDLSEMYNSTTSAKRGIRYLNGRRQILLRDEINTSGEIQWRMHTNATVTLSNNGATATLDLGGEQLIASIRSPSGAAFTTQTPAARLDSDPTTTVYNGETVTASADQPNPGVTVLMIDVAAGDQTLEVLFNPQWPGWSESSYVSPPSVALDSWSLTSHE
ncbi:hypothetical protein C6P46_005645 [Rhodotorula mucilaginosa]|uniref:Heparinase II/III-like C-terminal domain-containing protein n=1 Tax=Rhodotorula mucilaginosa TaxID=5537 RepID=A0A9P7B4G8_RHOMI|nr:hypothetical protein C6P46_005645 [Rhodotorula mucilaginosa]